MARESQPAVRVLFGGVAPCQVRALRELLAADAALVVIGAAADTRQTVAQAVALAPDVALLSFHVRELGGLETARRLRSAVPGCRVILLGDDEADAYHAAAGAAGASAYLTWLAAGQGLLPLLRRPGSAPSPSPEEARTGNGSRPVITPPAGTAR